MVGFPLLGSAESFGAPQVTEDLPELTNGSSRQLEVAGQVRREFVAGVNYWLMWALGHTADGDTSCRRAMGALMDDARAAQIVAEIEGAILLAPEAQNPRYWLDNACPNARLHGIRAVQDADERLGGPVTSR